MVRVADAVHIKVGRVLIEGHLTIPLVAAGLVVFADSRVRSRSSRRNWFVSQVFQAGGFATLLVDLLTREEAATDEQTSEYSFDVDRLGHRVIGAVDWAGSHPAVAGLPVACLGVWTGAAAVLIAAAERRDSIRAAISLSGRPDLAGYALPRVQAPTLLIVDGDDVGACELNRAVMRRMRTEVHLEVVRGATHRLEEPGALELVSPPALG